LLSAVDLVSRRPDASEAEVREWLEGNYCRCTGYHNIVKAVRAAARATAAAARAAAKTQPAIPARR
jgi:carbon-monoxide dehydrogenase small subunit